MLDVDERVIIPEITHARFITTSADVIHKSEIRHFTGCVKESNSGKALKLLIPNCSWKTTNGWSNHSCMVISQKMIKNEMGNRGSKSVSSLSVVKQSRPTGQKLDTEKEQRVDGSSA